MFVHQNRLRHLLRPEHYVDPTYYHREIEALFVPAWHFAVCRDEVGQPGEYVTLDVFGVPVIIRNFDGEIRAFRNVCPHRHAILRSEPAGRCDTLRCQYHGWEFNVEGRTGKIPEAKAFRPWDRENSHLVPVRVDQVGQLLFVAISDQAPGLKQWLGPLHDELQQNYDATDWRHVDSWEFDNPCNWKVPVENTLESYHIAEVHPAWMGGNLPAESNTHHALLDSYSTLDYAGAALPSWLWAKRYLGGQPHGYYRHWQVYPNMTFAMTDTFNYLATHVPTSPTTCRSRTRMFSYGVQKKGAFASLVKNVSWRKGRQVMKQIFTEDRTIYAAQQLGLQSSPHPGVIGAREERVFQFQAYVCDRMGIEVPADAAEAARLGPAVAAGNS